MNARKARKVVLIGRAQDQRFQTREEAAAYLVPFFGTKSRLISRKARHLVNSALTKLGCPNLGYAQSIEGYADHLWMGMNYDAYLDVELDVDTVQDRLFTPELKTTARERKAYALGCEAVKTAPTGYVRNEIRARKAL